MKIATQARAGTGMWLVQRGSAVLLALLLPLLLARIVAALPLDAAGWRALFLPAGMRVALLVAALAWALHAWVGMRDILMDYVRWLPLRLGLSLAVIVTLTASVLWLEVILWRLP